MQPFLSYCPNWKNVPLYKEWQKYAKRCYGGGMKTIQFVQYSWSIYFLDDVQTVPKHRLKTNITPISIPLDSDGRPKIPNITKDDEYKAKTVQAMLRNFLTAHIRKHFSDDLYIYLTQEY